MKRSSRLHQLRWAIPIVLALAGLCLVPALAYDPTVHKAGDHPFMAAAATTWRTAGAVVIGLLAATMVGYVVGIVLGVTPLVRHLGLAGVRVAGGVPVAVWLYLLMVPHLPLELSTTYLPVTLVFVASVAPVCMAVYETVRRVDESDLVLHLRHLGARGRALAGVYAVAALPTALEGAQINSLLAWSLALFAETSGVGQKGFGIELRMFANMGSARLGTVAMLGAYISVVAYLCTLVLQVARASTKRLRVA